MGKGSGDEREGETETRIHRSVNYETTCLMTRPDPTRCKFFTRGWSFKPSRWYYHTIVIPLVWLSFLRPRLAIPSLTFPVRFALLPSAFPSHLDTRTHFSVIRYLFLIFDTPFLLSFNVLLSVARFRNINFIFWEQSYFLLMGILMKQVINNNLPN